MCVWFGTRVTVEIPISERAWMWVTRAILPRRMYSKCSQTFQLNIHSRERSLPAKNGHVVYREKSSFRGDKRLFNFINGKKKKKKKKKRHSTMSWCVIYRSDVWNIKSVSIFFLWTLRFSFLAYPRRFGEKKNDEKHSHVHGLRANLCVRVELMIFFVVLHYALFYNDNNNKIHT